MAWYMFDLECSVTFRTPRDHPTHVGGGYCLECSETTLHIPGGGVTGWNVQRPPYTCRGGGGTAWNVQRPPYTCRGGGGTAWNVQRPPYTCRGGGYCLECSETTLHMPGGVLPGMFRDHPTHVGGGVLPGMFRDHPTHVGGGVLPGMFRDHPTHAGGGGYWLECSETTLHMSGGGGTAWNVQRPPYTYPRDQVD